MFLQLGEEEQEGMEDGRPFMDLEVVEEIRKEDEGKTSEEKAETVKKGDTLEREKGDEQTLDDGEAEAGDTLEREKGGEQTLEKGEAETMEKGDVGKKDEGETRETGAMNKKDKEDAVVKGKGSTNKGKERKKESPWIKERPARLERDEHI